MLFRLYTPVFILQAFCLYHAYKTRADQKWFYLIIFLPVIGCLLYLYDTFFNKPNLTAVTEGVKTVLFTNYTIEKLEKELTFSDNVTNRVNLANEYMKYERYAEAATLYETCLDGFMADDLVMKMRLLQARYMNKEYDVRETIGKKLESQKEFKKSEERIAYAWALHHTKQTEQAAAQFADMDRSFTNHTQRKEYARFLMETGQSAQATQLLDELVTEFEQMKEIEKRLNREIYREVRGMRSTINPPDGQKPATS
jgi:hypothetical protein